MNIFAPQKIRTLISAEFSLKVQIHPRSTEFLTAGARATLGYFALCLSAEPAQQELGELDKLGELKFVGAKDK